MQRTSVPSVYLRGTRYVLCYRDGEGKQRKESFSTLREARIAKEERRVAIHQGTYQPESHKTLHKYASEWIDSYDGIRENTRDDYRRGINLALEFFSPRVKLTAVTPKAIADYVAWLKKEKKLQPASVALRVAPLRSMFRTAREQGLVRHSPTDGLRIPRQINAPNDDDHEDHDVKVFSREQLQVLLAIVQTPILFELLACTGLRISEALALEWRHIELNGSKPHVKIRRALVRGKIGPPKSKYGRRSVPLPHELVLKLRTAQGDGLVFPTDMGNYLNANDVRRRVLKPALEEAGCAWAGFHTFRHTFASLHLAQGTNLVALSRVLGHHSPAFTLNTYAHLLEGDEAPALNLTSMPPIASDGQSDESFRLDVAAAEVRLP